MADQKRWFKLWCSAPSDDDLQHLPPHLRWAWAALGCYTKLHGTRGRLLVNPTNAVLAAEMAVPLDSLFQVIKQLPHVRIEEGFSANGTIAVTWDNWQKYQEDSTVAERVARLRSKRRGEENKKREEKEVPPVSPSPLRDEARAVLAFLNEKTSRHYRDTEANLRLIECRLRDGATLQDCKTIIAKKWRDWGTDPKMTSYVRPATLFNATKFEQYRGEIR